jgi:hypothetical protein
MRLMRADKSAGYVEVVFRDSRTAMSEGERRDVSIEGGCTCDADRDGRGDIVGTEGRRSSASRDCRSDFSLKSSVSFSLGCKRIEMNCTSLSAPPAPRSLSYSACSWGLLSQVMALRVLAHLPCQTNRTFLID